MELFDQLLSRLEEDLQPTSVVCTHETRFTDQSGRIVCCDCSELIAEHFLVDGMYNGGLKKRKVHACSIYATIPSFISQDVKELTVQIYKTVCGTGIFRNTLKKSIIFACLYRALILKKYPLYYDNLLEIFELKSHDANIGINYVANNLEKVSEYSIPFCTDEINIASVLSTVDQKDVSDKILRLFDLLKTYSDVLNNSQNKSVVCGCVFFWITYKKKPMDITKFKERVKMSESTILKKFVIVKEILLKTLMKKFLCRLLVNCEVGEGKRKRQMASTSLWSPKHRVFVTDYTSEEKIGAYDSKRKFHFPMDEIVNLDITEWNFFLDNSYVDNRGREYALEILVTKTTRDITFNFSHYKAGFQILNTLLDEFFN